MIKEKVKAGDVKVGDIVTVLHSNSIYNKLALVIGTGDYASVKVFEFESGKRYSIVPHITYKSRKKEKIILSYEKFC